MYLLILALPFCLLLICSAMVIYNHQGSRIRVRKIISKDFNGKKLFILRVNSADFLFEESQGDISILTKIKEPSQDIFKVDTKLAEKAMHLLELENMGHS